MMTEDEIKWAKIVTVQNQLDINQCERLCMKLSHVVACTTDATADERIKCLKDMGFWKD